MKARHLARQEYQRRSTNLEGAGSAIPVEDTELNLILGSQMRCEASEAFV
jgi:hypothetical protein